MDLCGLCHAQLPGVPCGLIDPYWYKEFFGQVIGANFEA